jgi:hypothetical protein
MKKEVALIYIIYMVYLWSYLIIYISLVTATIWKRELHQGFTVKKPNAVRISGTERDCLIHASTGETFFSWSKHYDGQNWVSQGPRLHLNFALRCRLFDALCRHSITFTICLRDGQTAKSSNLNRWYLVMCIDVWWRFVYAVVCAACWVNFKYCTATISHMSIFCPNSC